MRPAQVLVAVMLGAVVAAVGSFAGSAASAPAAAPFVIHQTTAILATGPDGDLFAEPEEPVTLSIGIRNVGDAPATGISATLVPQGFTVQQATSTYPDLAPGASATNATPFAVTFPAGGLCGGAYHARLAVATQERSFSLPVVVPLSSVARSSSWTSTAPVAIPDETFVESPLSLGTSDPPGTVSTILDLNVRIDNLQHTYDADLFISLRLPVAGSVNLVAYRGNGPNFVNTVLDDEASTSLDFGAPPFTGSFIPDSTAMLAAVDGFLATGTWRLRVRDAFPGDTGQLNSWGIDAVTTKCNTAPAPSFDSTPIDPVVGRPATLTATSNDNDGQVVAHAWDLDDDGQFDDATGTTVRRAFTAPGSVNVHLRAVDDGGNAAIASQELIVVRPRPVCRVPRVVGKKLVAARSSITRAGCRVGRIRRARSRRVGRVLSQQPRGGSVRGRGTRVHLVVGRR